MTIFNYKLIKALDSILPTKTFVITTKTTTKFIKITSLMQLLIITFLLSFGMFCSIKYRIYTNNNNVAFLLEENELLKREKQQYENYYTTIANQVDAINEYLGNNKESVQSHNKPNNINEIKNKLNKKIALSYNSLNKRGQEISLKISALGIERLAYSKVRKVVKIDNIDNHLFAEEQSVGAVGGKYEPVKKIQTIEMAPVIEIPSANINEKNLNKEIKKIIKAEKFLNSLPVGRPMKSDYRITSKFGIRNDPFAKSTAVHRGLDIVISDKKIYAPADGKVVFAGKNTGYGNMITIEHNMNKKEIGNIPILTRYGHLDKILVKEGDIVKKGQLIAIEGTTGRSTAAHLHFETIINGQHFNPVYFLTNGKESV